ncbi:MAG: hypothetical protein PHT07_15200 [Paludibacter sp.]|nr:hypothetical protein [Paludibacter sp.]
MWKKALRIGTVGFAIYGVIVLGKKVMDKQKVKKEGGDPKSIKWIG